MVQNYSGILSADRSSNLYCCTATHVPQGFKTLLPLLFFNMYDGYKRNGTGAKINGPPESEHDDGGARKLCRGYGEATEAERT
eukprot:515787-Rhodomonas_salina.1